MFALRCKTHGRRLVDPAPFTLGAAKDRADDGEVAIDGRRRDLAVACEAGRRVVDYVAGDFIEAKVPDVRIQRPEAGDVALVRAFVSRFARPAYDGLAPCLLRAIADMLLPP